MITSCGTRAFFGCHDGGHLCAGPKEYNQNVADDACMMGVYICIGAVIYVESYIANKSRCHPLYSSCATVTTKSICPPPPHTTKDGQDQNNQVNETNKSRMDYIHRSNAQSTYQKQTPVNPIGNQVLSNMHLNKRDIYMVYTKYNDAILVPQVYFSVRRSP